MCVCVCVCVWVCVSECVCVCVCVCVNSMLTKGSHLKIVALNVTVDL